MSVQSGMFQRLFLRRHRTVSGMHAYNIEYVPYSKDRLDDIVELMLDTFFTHEPLALSVQRAPGSGREDVLDWLRPCIAGWTHDVMLLAVDADEDRLVGATLNNVITAEHRDTWSWPRHAGTEYARLVFDFTEELGHGVDVFAHFGATRILHRCMTAVHPDYHHQGIAKELVDTSSFDLARKDGCQAVVAGVTHRTAQKILLNQGFEVLRELRYCESKTLAASPYFDENRLGHHKSAKLMGVSLTET
ncbi:uncharacterized protein LOC119099850 [Pollicipes pollicipes]|uniref:uncharacterized protein LOC119099850 n=1 Tax=Pollicipes pollicipes TaxID=41117 RepID=UPI0018857B2F|nr:uncharacterized protein LOC119099850 [Pollicipes pollicipes]